MTTRTTHHRRFTRVLLAAATLGFGAAAAVALDREPPLPDRGGFSAGYARGTNAESGAGVPLTATPPQAGPRSKYQTLLRQFAAPDDRASYGEFTDYGYSTTTSYAGQSDLPPGYWVYLQPNWYIFQSVAGEAAAKAAWCPEQMIGKPDTPEAGDMHTAWASATQDGQREWVELTFAEPTDAVAVMVYETYNPGAVDRVTATVGNETVDVWQGTDPTDPSKPKGVSVIAFKTAVKTNRVRIHLDSPRVKGWNEIDAVGLLAADGTTQWATGATASSSYGATGGGATPLRLDETPYEPRSGATR